MLHRIVRALLLCLAALSLPATAADNPERLLTVFGAASLTNVLQEVGDAFTKDTTEHVRFSFAASSMLAKQIESGARADVFFCADIDWMDYLQARNLIQKASRHDVLGNRLVLIAPADSKLQLKIEAHFKILAALADGHLATGDPDSVPAGRYARAALTTLGVWNDVANRLVRAEDVRSAMMFVARGEVPLGIVYRTDALIDKKVRIVDTFPADTHPPITYPVALTTVARPNAQKFIDYLRGSRGQAIFEKYGFAVFP
jgi:molybdate transport system substrate-binding protein